jgi:hypothetical protein
MPTLEDEVSKGVVLPKRFVRHGPALHRDKTRLVAFGQTQGFTAGKGRGKPPGPTRHQLCRYSATQADRCGIDLGIGPVCLTGCC